MKKRHLIASSVVLVLSLAACGADVPSVADGQKVLDTQYKELDCLKVISFEKTDGQKSEGRGIQGYAMWYNATLELRTGCYGFYSDKSKKMYSDPKKERTSLFDQGVKNMSTVGYRLVQDGDKISISGKLDFSKSEKGWTGRQFRF